MKYYFQHRGDLCYSKEYWIKHMQDLNIKEMPVFEAKRVIGSDYIYCKAYEEIGEKGQGCGKECKYYSPRNGKSGICKEWGYVYEQTEIKKVLRIDKL